MAWVGELVRAPETRKAYAQVEAAAVWSPWCAFASGSSSAPRLPGVYLFREPQTQLIRYAGMAGERTGSGRPQGLLGRLAVYRTGKGAVSGFGEAALDRALGDTRWVQSQLDRLREDGPRRAKEWAADAIERVAPELSWAVVAERTDARSLEDEVVLLIRPHGLWNR